MRILSFLTRYSRGLLFLGIFVSVLSGAVYSALIGVVNQAVESTAPPTAMDLWYFGALLLAFPISRTAAQLLLAYIGQRALADLRVRLAGRILDAPLRSLESLGKARLLASLTDDIQTVSNAIGNLPLLVMHAAVAVGCLIFLAYLSLPLFAAVVGFVVLAMGTYYLGLGRALRYLGMARKTQDRLFHHLRSLIEGVKELKLNAKRKERFLYGLLDPTGHLYSRQQVSAAARLGIAGSWVSCVYFLLVGLLLYAAPTYLGTGRAVVIQVVLTLMFMVISLDVISQLLPALGRASVGLANVDKLGLSLEDTMSRRTGALLLPQTVADWDAIELDGVRHTYFNERDGDTFSMGPFDLRFERGSLVFLVGGNGSGKTTLAKILTGLYAPEEGEIRIGGEVVTDAGRDAYREVFSAVFSDFHLFDSLLGLDGPDLDARASAYLERLHLERKVAVEDGALSTTDELSQGQRKRLALLVAYLEDRPVYVFDEWAADQDPEFKEVFYRRLLPDLKARGKTVFVISHDDRYFDVADRILKLNYGRLEADLTPEQLPDRWERLEVVEAGR